MPTMRRKTFGFCRARMGNVNPYHSIRPPGNAFTLGEGEDEDMADEKEEDIEEPKSAEKAIIDQEGEEKEEEARNIKGKKLIRQPNQEEYDEHMRTHMPFRKWCPHCVKGKRKNDPHKTPLEKEDQEIPTMSWDYMEQRGKVEKC